MTNWLKQNVTILGLGKSGYAAAKYLKQQDANVLVSENGALKNDQAGWADELKQLGIEIETGGHSQKGIEQADLIITSPGIPPSSPVMQMAEKFGKEVICDIELAYRETSIPIIAITGTNGKSTTTALISHILEFNGLKAPSCGNIGSPVMDYVTSSGKITDILRRGGLHAPADTTNTGGCNPPLHKPDDARSPVGARLAEPYTPPDFLIMEVSSYQLYYTKNFSPFVAIWLNLTPDHLDWHGTMEAYIAAKDRVLGAKTTAILNMDDPIVALRPAKAKLFPFSLNSNLKDKDPAAFLSEDWLCYRLEGKIHRVCSISQMPVIGQHNVENALAAIAATVMAGLSAEQIGNAIKKFKALEHRLEYVDTVNGIACYNDSKATNPESVIKALQAFKEKIVLIAGGKDKGTDLSELSLNVRDKTAAVILLGEAKDRFEKAFKQAGVSNIHTVSSLEEAVNLGFKLKLGPLLLSPACASYDMFKNFEQRGDTFKNLIQKNCAQAKPVCEK